MAKFFQAADNFLKKTDTIEKLFKRILLIVAVLSAISVGIYSYLPVYPIIKDIFFYIWLFVLTLFSFATFNLVRDFRKRFIEGYTVNLNRDQSHIWESRDGSTYKTNLDSHLIVTNSFEGCITKVGRFWENYDLTFSAKIIHQCIGVIFRAESINDYYMFQINHDSVVPHRKSLIAAGNANMVIGEDNAAYIKTPDYAIVWENNDRTPLNIGSNVWFDVRVSVRGDTATLYINNEFVLTQSFIRIPAGKIGFRNDGAERALVRNIKISLLPYE